MANIIGCGAVSLESYYKRVKDFKYNNFSSLDLALLSKNIDDIRNVRRTKVPVFDLESGARSGFKELEVSEDCGGVRHKLMQLKIRNDFDPVLSPESSLFVLKSNKKVAYQDILTILDPAKFCSSVQKFIDLYFKLPGSPSNGQLTEGDCIRVKGKFALLMREPIREGNFIIQPKVDSDIAISTVTGLLNLGYQAVAYIEASAFIYQDRKVLWTLLTSALVGYIKGSVNDTLEIHTIKSSRVLEVTRLIFSLVSSTKLARGRKS